MRDQRAQRDTAEGNTRLRALEHLFCETRIALVSCRTWQYSAPWELSWRKCTDSFFFFPFRGSVRATCKGKSVSLAPGQFMMLAEATDHSLTLETGSSDLGFFALHGHLHDQWGRPLLARFSAAFGNLPALPRSLQALQEIAELMVSHPLAGQQRGKSFLRELLAAQLADGISLRLPPQSADPRVGVALQTMEENLGRPELSIEALANEVNLSVVQLRKLFRRETGMNPKIFLNSLRLREATRRLRQTSDSIKEVAAACGFSQDHYFHQVFRKTFSCTPREYRANGASEV